MQPHTINVTNFGDAAGAFIDAGFPERDLLPLIPPGASLSSSSKVQPSQIGKIPGRYTGSGWCGLTGSWPTMGLDLATVTNARNWQTPNVGLRAAGFPAIDIDTDSETGRALAERAMQGVVATDGPVRTRGGAARALCMYKLAEGSEPIRKRRLVWLDAEGVEHAVEVLGFGQQYVVAGVHPLGSEYVWDRQPEADKLPELLVQDVEAYMERLEGLINATGGTVISSTMRGAGSGLEIDYANADPVLDENLALEILRAFPNTHETLPERESLVRVLASFKTAMGRDAESLRDRVMEWACADSAWCPPEYFDQIWDSLHVSHVPAEYLVMLGRKHGCHAAARFSAVQDFKDHTTNDASATETRAEYTARTGALIVAASDGAVANLATVAAILRDSAAGLFRYDLMRSATLITRSPVGETDFIPRPVEDNDVVIVQEILQCGGLRHVSKNTVADAIELVARENSFHPVRDYINGLVWDGRERLPSLFPTYFGSENTEYTRMVGRVLLISMIARVFQPGCKVDHMVVLEGGQGTGKSTAIKILGGEWFSDALPDVTSKDASQHLRGRWVIEFAEMYVASKAEANALKSFITRTDELYRPSYGRFVVNEPRQCVFIGSTNETEYLRDATGARRFLPVETGEIDTAGLARDRDQILAEAYARYKRGENWWPDRDFETRIAQVEQEARFEADPFETAIAEYLDDKEITTLEEVSFSALKRESVSLSMAEKRRAGAVMRRLGWESGKSNGKKVWRKASAGAAEAA